MIKRYSDTIINYYDKFFDTVFNLDKKKIIQYVNLSLPSQGMPNDSSKLNEQLDWYVNITHQEASVERNFQDWFIRQFLYSYCDTIVLNQLMLSYRKANMLVYELQNKIEGKNKDIYIMSKDLDIKNIANIEFLKTEYTNKYLCIKQALVNDTFDAIDDQTEAFMRENYVKLLPLKYVSSLGITERLIQSKKYKSILLEDDALNNKFTDIKYPKQYLPDILLLAVSTEDLDDLTNKPKFANFNSMLKENYAIQSDVHMEDEGMKYFSLLKRQKGIKHDYDELFQEIQNSQHEDLELRKRVQPGINVLKKERQKTRRQEE